MLTNIGVLCSEEGLELAAVLEAVQNERVPAEIKIVIADRDSSPLALARSVGVYGCFVPRASFHANRDGFERRLVDLLKEAEVEAVVMANFLRDPGPVLKEAFPDKLISLEGLPYGEVAEALGRKLRGARLKLLEEK